MADRASSRLPLVILALALGVIFHRLLLGEVLFWGLPALQFYPWREFSIELLRDGQLPLWNPYNGAGAPLLANYQSALLYPLNWPSLVLPLAWAMSLTAVVHLFLAGWGMWLFTGRLGLSSLGRGISALAFGLTGYLVARLGTYPTISAAAWLPWILWAILGLHTRSCRQDFGWMALFVGLQLLAGHAQTTWYSLLLAGAFSVWWSITHRPLQWRRQAVITAGLALGAGIAAAQLVPTAELLAQSQRSGGVDYDRAVNFSYSLERTLNWLAPNVFGSPGDGTYITEQGAFFEDAVYVGLIPLVSALAAVITWLWGRLRRAPRPAQFASVPFWLVILVTAYILALGKHSPVFPFLYHNIPTFDLFQAPVRWHLWTVFAMSVLAGIGASMWGHGHWLFFGTRLATAGCLGAALLAVFAPRFLPPDIAGIAGVQAILQAVITTGILGALAGSLTLIQPEEQGSRLHRLWSLAVLIVIAGDLGWAAQGLNPTQPAAFYDRRTPADAPARAYWPPDTQNTVMYDRFLQFDDYRVASLNAQEFRASGLPNFNLIDRVPLLNNFDPLLVGRFAEFLRVIEDHPDQRARLLRAAGVDAIYQPDGRPQIVNAPSRAWLVESACWHPDQETLIQAMLDARWDAHQQVHLIGAGDCSAPPADVTPLGAVSRVADDAGRVDIELDSVSRPGWLVLADTYYPGWRAADGGGQALELYPANLAFRAVPVSPGITRVQFVYEPGWIWPGILLSIVSLLVLLVIMRSRNPTSSAG